MIVTLSIPMFILYAFIAFVVGMMISAGALFKK